MLAAALILAVVMILVVWQPRHLEIAWPALGGAIACFALGLIGSRDLKLVAARTWNAALALIGLMLLSEVLNDNGAFRAAARRIARASHGDGRRLFVGLCLLTAGAAALLGNDGAILLATPIVADLALALDFAPAAALGYLFSVGFLCDALSTALPASNLTNILLADTLHIGAGDFAAHMLLPWLVMFVVSLSVLALQFRRSLPRVVAIDRLTEAPPFASGATIAALLTLVFGYVVAELLHFPLGLMVLLVALALALFEHHAGRIGLARVARRLPLHLVVFAAALMVIVTALFEAGASRYFALFLSDRPGLVPLLRAGGAVSALSAVANNLPAFLSTLLAMDRWSHSHALPFAALLGANVGSKLTPIGSLATLIWLGLLRQRGIRVSWPRYLLVAFAPTMLTLLAGLLTLALLSR